jgi:hypothetical protein
MKRHVVLFIRNLKFCLYKRILAKDRGLSVGTAAGDELGVGKRMKHTSHLAANHGSDSDGGARNDKFGRSVSLSSDESRYCGPLAMMAVTAGSVRSHLSIPHRGCKFV